MLSSTVMVQKQRQVLEGAADADGLPSVPRQTFEAAG
jgi:hypothetical protein